MNNENKSIDTFGMYEMSLPEGHRGPGGFYGPAGKNRKDIHRNV